MSRRRGTQWRPVCESLEGRQLLAAPVLDPIASAVVPAGKSLILPVTASDTDGDTLTYTVTSDGAPVSARLHTGNPYLKLSVAGYGDMTFQLLGDLAPSTVAKIRGLIDAKFYDGLKFHRVVKDFMIQGGDPKGDGTGGPGFTFEDEFNPKAIFSGDGQLAMANSGKDTNGSQFFVTTGPQRFLDFNHAIFAQLVRGFDVLRAINSVPVTSSAPNTPVVITSASIVQNTTDAVLTLDSSGLGTSNITVNVSDGKGGSDSKTFQANATADTTNDPPILGPVGNQTTLTNQAITIPLSSLDLEGDAVTYGAALIGNPPNATMKLEGNVVTVTPASGFLGDIRLLVGVRQTNATSRGSTSDPFDKQTITITVREQSLAIGAYDLVGTEGVQFLNTRVATFTALGSGPIANFNTSIDWGDNATTPGQIVARSDGGFDVLASRAYPRFGSFPLKVTVRDITAAKEATASAQVNITDAPLTGSFVAKSPSAGVGAVSGVIATIVDANPSSSLQDLAATIDWGDGTVTPGQLTPRSGGGYDVYGTRTYITSRAFPVRVQVRSAGGANTTAEGTLTISGVPSVVVPPVVVTPLVTPKSVAVARDRSGAVTSMTLKFSSELDRVTASEVANYRLFGPGTAASRRFRSATYNAASRTIKLVPMNGRLVVSGTMQLRVNGLKDKLGRLVDGNQDGNPGGELVASLTRQGITISTKKR